MNTIQSFLLVILFFTALTSEGQEFRAGFEVIRTYDSSRTYKPDADVKDKLYYRPIDIDLWYPAIATNGDTTASFGDLIGLLEQRSGFYDGTKDFNGLTEEMLQYLCSATDCPDHLLLKNIQTDSYVGADRSEQPSPLIIYFAGFNGMSYENYHLFEALAKNGFTVASVSSIGRYPGNMTMEAEDLLEQVKDGEYIIRYLTQTNRVSGNIGSIGYSWGGLAAAIASMNNPALVKAMVSLDGSEQFAYSGDDESKKLDRIRESDFFKPGRINSYYLYLDSDVTTEGNMADSIFNITDHLAGNAEYLKINHSRHEDFSSLSILSRDLHGSHYELIQQLVVAYFLDKLKGKITFKNGIPVNKVTKQFSQPALVIPENRFHVFQGIISDKKSGQPLPYVNVGIVNKDIGTASDAKGTFKLKLTESNINDTIKISMIGYEPKIILIKDILYKNKWITNIQLLEETRELTEVVVAEKKLTSHILGNKTQSKFFGGKFASGDLGSEIAIRVRIKRAPTYLDTFAFNISYNTGDTAAFRVNIYEAENGLPGRNILKKNIILKVTGQTGKMIVDLSEHNLIVTDDFFVALEWIEGNNNSGIVFSAGFVNKATYYRKASQGQWRKHSMGVGFNVTVKY